MPEARKLAENEETLGFTIYLEGHDGHQGNVLAHAFVWKVQRLILVLNKLERIYIASGTRRTDFEIVAADKHNPTTLTLKPVPRDSSTYRPAPALNWSMRQIEAVGRGELPDERVGSEVALDLVKLATKETDDGYKAFWINGYAEAVRFDDEYLHNARQVARERVKKEAPNKWRVGAATGSIVGELKKIDDFDAENEFVIVPPTGAEFVRCKFPASMKEKMGQYVFKTVRVSGTLFYGEDSPFPYLVEAADDGVEFYPAAPPRRSFADMRGIFAGRERRAPDWDLLLNGL